MDWAEEVRGVELYLLFDASSFLFVFGGLHGGGSPSGRLARFGVRVNHPPGTLARPFVLHPHETVMQRQIVTYRILSNQ